VRWPLAVFLVLFLAFFAIDLVQAKEFPDPVGYVNDFASMIEESVESDLESSLRQFEEEATVEVVVVTVPDLGVATVEDYAVRLFQEWRIGKQSHDNGILFLIEQEEGWLRIEVGYGMEPYLADGQAGRILDSEVVPDYKAGHYSSAIFKGTQAITEAVIDNGYQPGAVRPPREDPLRRYENYSWLFFPLAIGSIYLISFMARTKEVVVGALWGTAVGALVGWVAGAVLWSVIIGPVMGVFGLLMDTFLSRAYKHQVKSGKSTTWRNSWGGFSGGWGGGGWGGGRGGGGGFGGFGGGRSGGGGASRRAQ
jgi:uncharacterized protein